MSLFQPSRGNAGSTADSYRSPPWGDAPLFVRPVCTLFMIWYFLFVMIAVFTLTGVGAERWSCLTQDSAARGLTL
jgi:hypothetical protein